MVVKKRKVKSAAKYNAKPQRNARHKVKRSKAKKVVAKPKAKQKKKAAIRKKSLRETHPSVEDMLKKELDQQGKDMFYPEKETFMHWVTRYSPVLISMGIGLATYFFLVFYLFYPITILQGHYMQLLTLLVFVSLIIGVLMYLGLRAELIFVRILSFIFVFVIFTFLLLFILIAYSLQSAVV